MLAQSILSPAVLDDKAAVQIAERVVQPDSNAADQPIFQDVMGQFPQLMSYNHGIAFFKLDEGVDRKAVVDMMEGAAAKVVSQIPWLGQRVVCDGAGPGVSGTYHTAPWGEDEPTRSIVRVKDCSDLAASYDEMLAKDVPVSMLDPDTFCPVPGFPTRYDEQKYGPPPACLVQVNFIKGGAAIAFSNQHNVMDGTGIFTLIQLLVMTMNGSKIPSSWLKQANRDRSTVIPLYGPNEPIRDHGYLAAPPIVTPPLEPARWSHLRLDKDKLPQIKAVAMNVEGYDREVPFISSGDAVSALYWKCLARARVNRGQDPSSVSRFSRAIDSRAAMKVPPAYMGQMVYSSRTFFTHQELLDLPLSTITCAMRKNLNHDNSEHAIRSFATYVSRIQDKNQLTYAGPANRATDISSSSMAQAALVLNAPIVGTPTHFRRPNLPPINGNLYFYPPEVNEDLNLLVCLNEGELSALMADELWGQSARLIG